MSSATRPTRGSRVPSNSSPDQGLSRTDGSCLPCTPLRYLPPALNPAPPALGVCPWVPPT